jgi:glutamate synthase (NADPH/NADH) small chain
VILRTSSSHDEGVQRDWSINTVRFTGDADGRVEKLHGVRLKWVSDADGRRRMEEVPGSAFALDVDLVLLAMGFLGPEKKPLLADLGVAFDPRGNVRADANYMTSVPGVFACGDLRRGQSLVVWAIWEGRECAVGVDAYLRGHSDLLRTPLVNPLVLQG